jgi:valyl-tRNA synthetase
MRFVPERGEHFRNFCNKMWNASRFVLSNLGDTASWTLPDSLTLPDMWICTKLQILVYDVTGHLDKYELNLAAQKLLDFIWDDFCDWYIELAKIQLRGGATADTTRQILAYILETSLRLLHPIAPHITEEIWQSFPDGLRDGEALMIAKWPESEDRLRFTHEAAQMEMLMDAVRVVRSRRNEMKVPPSKKAAWTVETAHAELFEAHSDIFKALAGASDVTVFSESGQTNRPDTESSVTLVASSATIYLPLAELVDLEAEKARLAKERAAAQKEYDILQAKLDNPGFTEKAPEKIVLVERERLAALREKLDRL